MGMAEHLFMKKEGESAITGLESRALTYRPKFYLITNLIIHPKYNLDACRFQIMR